MQKNVSLTKQTKETERILQAHGKVNPNLLMSSNQSENYESVQITNDIYNRIQFIEMASFFFGYSGLGMAVIEYELRHYLIHGEFLEGEDPNHTEPIGMSMSKERML